MVQKPNMMLLDVDGLIWKYTLSPKSSDFDFDGVVKVYKNEDDVDQIVRTIDQKISLLMEDLNVQYYTLCLGRGETFRHKLWPDYKKHRPPQPPLISKVYTAVIEHFGSQVCVLEGLESDDVLGLLHKIDGSTVITSNDKDLLTLPGWFYNWKKPQEGMRWISQGSADLMLLMQTLAGDPSDGYPGVPGIGVEKAKAILMQAVRALGTTSFDRLWPVVLMAYVVYGLSTDDAWRNLRLAEIAHSNKARCLRACRALPKHYIKILNEVLHNV